MSCTSKCLIGASLLVFVHTCLAQGSSESLAMVDAAAFEPALSAAGELPDAPMVATDSGSGVASVQPLPIQRAATPPLKVNGQPYVRPTARDHFNDYVKNTYGLPALAFTSARAAIAQLRGKPEAWGQDWAGFGQRFGSAAATTAIEGNVRYGMEMAFKEDMRYIPCHGCSAKKKFENALLAEVTARHDADGHRFFTLTPTLSDMSGPMVANSFWIPGHTTIDGFIGSRMTFAYRIGGHLFTEFALDHRHRDSKLAD
jgi:hypothetical protein